MKVRLTHWELIKNSAFYVLVTEPPKVPSEIRDACHKEKRPAKAGRLLINDSGELRLELSGYAFSKLGHFSQAVFRQVALLEVSKDFRML
jgi:hypothetical protein